MNRDSLKLTVESGETHFWSRSRGELWHKGATSGNRQKVQSISYDCDADTLLVRVLPEGPACHTGAYTCFFNEAAAASEEAQSGDEPAQRFSILGKLESVIAQRDAE